MLESSLLLHYKRDSNIMYGSFATLFFKPFQGQNRLTTESHNLRHSRRLGICEPLKAVKNREPPYGGSIK